MNKTAVFFIVGGLVIAFLVYFMFIFGKGKNTIVNVPATKVTITPKPEVKTKISLAEVANHNTATDCWLAIENKVYNVTSFIAGNKHPGGEAILAGCGKDATVLFVGRGHSDKARSLLPDFYIGDLE